jgi:hypothetical protein
VDDRIGPTGRRNVLRGLVAAADSAERDDNRFNGRIMEFVVRRTATLLGNGERIDLYDTNSVTFQVPTARWSTASQ